MLHVGSVKILPGNDGSRCCEGELAGEKEKEKLICRGGREV